MRRTNCRRTLEIVPADLGKVQWSWMVPPGRGPIETHVHPFYGSHAVRQAKKVTHRGLLHERRYRPHISSLPTQEPPPSSHSHYCHSRSLNTVCPGLTCTVTWGFWSPHVTRIERSPAKSERLSVNLFNLHSKVCPSCQLELPPSCACFSPVSYHRLRPRLQ